MRRVTIAVIGNGKTTRANVEALIGDTIDSVDELNLALVHQGELSEGQVWAKQFIEDRQLEVIEFDNYADLVAASQGRGLSFFLLWDDEDPECQRALSAAQSASINAYDLTDGLVGIKPKTEAIPEPVEPEIPEVEAEVSDVSTEPEFSAPDPTAEIIASLTTAINAAFADLPEGAEDDEDFFTSDELLEEEEELGEVISVALEMIASVLAKQFVNEVKRLLDK